MWGGSGLDEAKQKVEAVRTEEDEGLSGLPRRSRRPPWPLPAPPKRAAAGSGKRRAPAVEPAAVAAADVDRPLPSAPRRSRPRRRQYHVEYYKNIFGKTALNEEEHHGAPVTLPMMTEPHSGGGGGDWSREDCGMGSREDCGMGSSGKVGGLFG
uniref:Uncharacterized protein n=1 Tax=Oryza sativa subsp. japonica TaxID=39947 RepID=Q6AVH2_ORYSJ|nr:hypothetical protein [Oryza sativa Japonica Group]